VGWRTRKSASVVCVTFLLAHVLNVILMRLSRQRLVERAACTLVVHFLMLCLKQYYALSHAGGKKCL
jgi:hypothetical protein